MRFSETHDAPPGSVAQTASKFLDLRQDCAPISHLADVTTSQEDREQSCRKLFAIHQDGEVECFDEHLDRKLYTAKVPLLDTEKVQLACFIRMREARQALLKNRDEFLLCAGSGADKEEAALLVLLTKTIDLRHAAVSSRLTLHLLSINEPSANIFRKARNDVKTIRSLSEIEIPEPESVRNREASFFFNSKSGLLYQRTALRILVYQMSSLVPKVLYDIQNDRGDFNTLLELDSNVLATSVGSCVQLINLPYCSGGKQYRLEEAFGKKVGNSSETASADTIRDSRILTYFPGSSSLIVLAGSRLLALPISALGRKSRKRNLATMLAESLGRGSYAIKEARSSVQDEKFKRLGTNLTPAEDGAWIELKSQMDHSFSSNERDAAMNQLMSTLLLDIDQAPSGSVSQHLLSYLLNQTFAFRPQEHPVQQSGRTPVDLYMRSVPSDVWQWLCEGSHVSRNHVESALRQSGNLPANKSISARAFINALVSWDPSLKSLHELIRSGKALGLHELICVLPHAIKQCALRDSHEGEKALLKDRTDNSNLVVVNGESSYQTASSTKALIVTLLPQIFRYPHQPVTEALQKHLGKTDLLSLIDILRLEVAHTGLLTSYQEEDRYSSLLLSSTIGPLRPIIHLLNSTVDAIGATGWLLQSTEDSHNVKASSLPSDLVSYMRAEISAALQGIEETVYLSGMLEDILICGKDYLDPTSAAGPIDFQHTITDTSTNSVGADKPLPSQFDGAQSSPGAHPAQTHGQAIVTIATEADLDTTSIGPPNPNMMLPLGLNLDKARISLTKVGAGGELIKRSRRDIGHMKSQRVGPYSFERIVV